MKRPLRSDRDTVVACLKLTNGKIRGLLRRAPVTEEIMFNWIKVKSLSRW